MKPSLEELKSLVRSKIQKEIFPFSYVEKGIPRGAITEIYGAGKTELVLRFILENPKHPVAWIEEKFSVFPTALRQQGMDLNRILFVEAGINASWAALQILKTQVFPIVVLYNENFDIRTLRRFQLLAERNQCALLWLSSPQTPSWPVSLQIAVQKNLSKIIVQTQKRKYGCE